MTVANAPALITDDAGTNSRRHPLAEPAPGRRPRRAIGKYLGLTPFAAYVLLFLAIPAILAVSTGFFTEDGAFTVANIAGIFAPNVLATFGSSFWVSAVTAVVGAVVGALVC